MRDEKWANDCGATHCVVLPALRFTYKRLCDIAVTCWYSIMVRGKSLVLGGGRAPHANRENHS